jgi:hypothetical protein
LKAASVIHEGHIYPGAVHGFNNDATPDRYNKAAADQAWQRTVEWFNKYVGADRLRCLSRKAKTLAQSGRERHRDRDPRRRLAEEELPSAYRMFRMTDAERQQVAKCLRYIDEARRALERQQNPDNREIIRELRASADQIFHVLSTLEETDT